MGNADKYRANAIHCCRMANKGSDPDDEQTWLNMAETWLGMIPERQRKPKKSLRRLSETKERDKGRPSRDIDTSADQGGGKWRAVTADAFGFLT